MTCDRCPLSLICLSGQLVTQERMVWLCSQCGRTVVIGAGQHAYSLFCEKRPPLQPPLMVNSFLTHLEKEKLGITHFSIAPCCDEGYHNLTIQQGGLWHDLEPHTD